MGLIVVLSGLDVLSLLSPCVIFFSAMPVFISSLFFSLSVLLFAGLLLVIEYCYICEVKGLTPEYSNLQTDDIFLQAFHQAQDAQLLIESAPHDRRYITGFGSRLDVSSEKDRSATMLQPPPKSSDQCDVCW